MDGKATFRFWIVALALFFLVGYSAVVTGKYHTAQEDLDMAKMAAQTAMGERENALARAEQYQKEYQNALLEIADLKSQVKELQDQIEVLREPPQDAYADTFGYDYDYVVRVVGAEARGEPFAGILAVAQCIADTADRLGCTPEDVVKSGQYTSPISRYVTDGMEDVNEACLMVFAEGMRPFDEPIEYFYAYKNGHSSWHETQTYCFTIGGHRYFKRAA